MTDDDKTPVDGAIWSMHPHDTVVGGTKVPETGKNQRVLEDILATVQGVLDESRDIKLSAQRSCDLAVMAFADMPRLKKRMARVEIITIGATLINILMLAASCHR